MSSIFNKNYRYQTIINWIKMAGLKVLSEKSKQEKVEVLKMDELYTCNGIDCVWSRSWKSPSFKKINLNIVCNESACLNANIKHVASKSNTCLVLRYYLAQLHSKTSCYSKSVLMLTLSFKLLLAYKYGLSWNGEQCRAINYFAST